jgi:hypothetical protein
MAGFRALRFDFQGLMTVQHRDPGGEQNGFVSQNDRFSPVGKMGSFRNFAYFRNMVVPALISASPMKSH